MLIHKISKCYILLIVSIMVIAHVCYGMKYKKKSKKEEALILISDGENYKFPGKYKNSEQTSQYFCPTEFKEFQNFDEFCLTKSEEGYCEKPVEPLLIKAENFRVPCGADGKSYYYDFVYRVCSYNDDKTGNASTSPIKINDVLLYRICYNQDIQRAMFTYHKIAKSTLLKKENSKIPSKNSVSYSSKNYGLSGLDFKIVKHSYSWQSSYRDPITNTTRIFEKLMLVPSDDMSSDLRKKPLHHYINVVPAWKNVLKVWNLINEYIRNMAISQEITMYQVNGILGELMLRNEKIYMHPTYNVAVPKYIWKLVYTEDNEFLAIVINNVPNDVLEVNRLCENNQYDIGQWNFPLKLRKLVYFCQIDEVRTLLHLPENLSLLEEEDNFAPLLLSTNKGKYDLPKTYHGIPQYEHTPPEYNFCYEGDFPNKNPTEVQCLAPIPNNRSQYCPRPLEPFADDLKPSESEFHCKGITFSFGYRICSKNIQSKKNSPYHLAIYNGCQDYNFRDTIFTYHRILSPALLTNKYLKNERQKSYQMERSNESNNPIPNPNFDTITEAYMAENFNHPLYGWIRQLPLTSPDDMAFALWRKPTFHRKNLKFAWENVIKIWSKINERIRTQAINKGQELIQLNGWEDQLTINGEKIETKNGYKFPAYFWKIVYTPDKEHSVAIILHNLPNNEILSSIRNLCADSKSVPIFKIEDLAYCCESNVISEKYGFPITNEIMKIEGLC